MGARRRKRYQRFSFFRDDGIRNDGITKGEDRYDVIRNYPLSGLMAPVQNIDVLESFPLTINVLLFLINVDSDLLDQI